MSVFTDSGKFFKDRGWKRRDLNRFFAEHDASYTIEQVEEWEKSRMDADYIQRNIQARKKRQKVEAKKRQKVEVKKPSKNSIVWRKVQDEGTPPDELCGVCGCMFRHHDIEQWIREDASELVCKECEWKLQEEALDMVGSQEPINSRAEAMLDCANDKQAFAITFGELKSRALTERIIKERN